MLFRFISAAPSAVVLVSWLPGSGRLRRRVLDAGDVSASGAVLSRSSEHRDDDDWQRSGSRLLLSVWSSVELSPVAGRADFEFCATYAKVHSPALTAGPSGVVTEHGSKDSRRFYDTAQEGLVRKGHGGNERGKGGEEQCSGG